MMGIIRCLLLGVVSVLRGPHGMEHLVRVLVYHVLLGLVGTLRKRCVNLSTLTARRMSTGMALTVDAFRGVIGSMKSVQNVPKAPILMEFNV